MAVQSKRSGLWSGGGRVACCTTRWGTSAFQLSTSDVGEMTIAFTHSAPPINPL
jgi:hypothetical protein